MSSFTINKRFDTIVAKTAFIIDYERFMQIESWSNINQHFVAHKQVAQYQYYLNGIQTYIILKQWDFYLHSIL